MRPRFLAVLALTLAAPASPALAQSFFPNLAGMRYCELRQMGVSQMEAMTVSMRENWSSSRPRIEVKAFNGGTYTTDVLSLTRYILSNCPAYLGN